MKGISVVIPNYNGKELLSEILPPLYVALDHSRLPYEVIVSDDCSRDDSVSFLKENFSSVILIENSRNRGFSPTINAGIFACRYDYVLLMNSDVKLEPDYFDNLLKYFNMPDTFGVMGRIIGWDNDKLQDGAKYPSFHGTKIKTTGNYISLQPDKNDRLYSMYLSGANAFVDRKKLIELGGFNELFAPFYVEDYELSLRAWRAGYKCYFEHFSVCRHKESVSIKTKNRKKYINTIYYRNKMYLHAIHLKGATFALWYIQNIFESLFQAVIGKTFYLKAFLLFSKNTRGWKASEKEFDKLCRDKKVDLSVSDVTDTILGSLKNKNIKKF